MICSIIIQLQVGCHLNTASAWERRVLRGKPQTVPTFVQCDQVTGSKCQHRSGRAVLMGIAGAAFTLFAFTSNNAAGLGQTQRRNLGRGPGVQACSTHPAIANACAATRTQ